jgi:hypothetical protein
MSARDRKKLSATEASGGGFSSFLEIDHFCPEQAALRHAELHAHTTWSDGALGIPAVVDLYGQQGFDVLCITDHSCNGGWLRVPIAA